jgi:glycosyltransferase involved in cell wall biosynthesis
MPSGVDVRRLWAVRVAKIPVMPTLVLAVLRTPRRAAVHLHLGQALVPELVWLATRLRRQRLIVHFHLDIGPSGLFGKVFVLYKALVLSHVLRAADRVVCLSDEQFSFLTEELGLRPEAVCVVPNAVDERFAVERLPTATPLARPLRLLFVGRLSAQKNLPRLLDAMALVREPVELAIVGDGELRSLVEARLGPTGLRNVELLGRLDGEALLDRYRWADALVLTSDHEGMPLVLLEAMAAGLPIVATDVPGIRTTVGDDALVVAATPEAVAAAIERLARDDDLRAELASRGRHRAGSHSWELLLDRLDAVYDGPSASR